MSQSVFLGIRPVVSLERSGQRSLAIRLRRVDRNGRIATSSAPPAPTITRLVDRDAIDPSSQIRLAAEVANALKRSQERLLRQVTRFFAAFRQPVEQTVNLTRAFVDQYF